MDLLIINGTVVTAVDTFRADLDIRDGRIAAMGAGLSPRGADTIDAAGCYVMPGGVDVHTHLNLEALGEKVGDGFYHGTVAAACGGTTCVVEHPGFGPPGCGIMHQIDAYHRDAEGQAVVDYAFHGVVQHAGKDLLTAPSTLIEAGIPSVKAYLTYSGRLDDGALLDLFAAMHAVGGLTAVHAENHAIVRRLSERLGREGTADPSNHPKSRPDYCEAEAVQRVIALSRAAGNAPVYIVHLSTAAGLSAVETARSLGLPVYAETCPQYLLLTEARYAEPDGQGFKYVMAPPLRREADCEALWRGLREGSIDVVATDHCGFDYSRKRARGEKDLFDCPGGVPGVETRVPLMFSEGVLKKRIGLNRFVELTATAPARIMGLYPRKGAVAPGSDADLMIFDPTAEKVLAVQNLAQPTDYTPFAGMTVKGWPRTVMQRGEVLVQDGRFVGRRGGGRFVRRRPFAAAPFATINPHPTDRRR